MGYYVDMYFSKEYNANFSSIISTIKREYPESDIYDERDNDVSIAIDGLSGFVCIFKEESAKQPGKWGYIRLSWSSDPTITMDKLVEISEKIGCRIYDEIEDENFDRITMGQFKRSFKNTADNVAGLLGNVEKT